MTRAGGGRWLLALAGILAVLGAVALGCGVADRAGTSAAPPPPSAVASAGPGTLVAPAAPPTRPAPATGPAPTGSVPATIEIPAIGVRSRVDSVGLNPDQTLEVPAPGPRYDDAAWYRGSVRPGEIGPSVVLGHVDSAAKGPSVFYDLGRLTTGDTAVVTGVDGVARSFRVDSVVRVPKDAFPTATVYGPTRRPELRLITCGGEFDRGARSYRDNTVVFAHLVD